jgi:hypothetical protein
MKVDDSMAKMSQKIDREGPDRAFASSKMAEREARLRTLASAGAKQLKALRYKVRWRDGGS